MYMQKQAQAERSDLRARLDIVACGWEITTERVDGIGRFAARQVLRNGDEERKLYESAFTLSDLARSVKRRAAEEAPKVDGSGAPIKAPVRVIDGVRDSVQK
jgi:hypothetical protein